MSESAGPSPGPALVLRAGAATATLYPDAGGRLGQLDLGDGPLLRAPADGLGWAHWGCYPLLPWSNRIPGGLLRYEGLKAQLPVNWPDGSAIHGLVASCPWTVVDQSANAAEVEVNASAGPYRVHGSQRFELEHNQLHLHLAARNEGDAPVPMGIGIHPWFRSGPIRVAADMRWPGEPVPNGAPVTVEEEYDLRTTDAPHAMDACFTRLTDTTAEVPGALLHWSGPITNVVVYTGERGWVCVEPVTMATNGFELAAERMPHHGVQVVPPGASLEVSFRIERSNVGSGG